MSATKTFHLPDLGEGLPDAEIVEWLVREGETVALDQPLVSMETAKAVVEVPAPFSGRLTKQYGNKGDVITTGAPLAEFELDAAAPQRAEGHATGHSHAPAAPRPAPAPAPVAAASDQGSVVGAMEASERVQSDAVSSVGGVRAMPAVRAMAKKLGIDLARVSPSGADRVVTMQDVKRAAASATGRTPAPRASLPQAAPQRALSGQPIRTTPFGDRATGEPERLRGVRRNMARVMAEAHAAVVPTTIVDDADIHAWAPGNDISVRLLRALVQACHAVPALNAWFDAAAGARTLHRRVDVGIAVDTENGLFVPALRNADRLDAAGLRAALDGIRAAVDSRSIAPEELRGYTIMLSNFGVFAGRYATPVVVPPCIAIVAAGKLRHEVVAVMGGIVAHRVIPLSLTFDHRAATGGEAARFLAAMLADLALPL
jgi:pyruvate dehydrogenase E2 component (dihydrolipoamide acetyltransferase)